MYEEPEKKIEYGNFIMRNAIRLQKMISDIRDMSKIDNNVLTLNKEQFNLNEFLSSTVDDIRENVMSYNKKINIVYNNNSNGINDKDIIIEGDKERIIQVISNILDNAIKFTNEGTISIDIEKNSDIDNNIDNSDNNNKSREIIIINMKDTGKGIDSTTFPHLFSKFFSTSGAGGTGLGLYICKSIVEAHGGKIWTKDNKEDGKGTIFSFSLPLYQQQQQQRQ